MLLYDARCVVVTRVGMQLWDRRTGTLVRPRATSRISAVLLLSLCPAPHACTPIVLASVGAPTLAQVNTFLGHQQDAVGCAFMGGGSSL
jgi:hypothetical protein